MTLSGTGVIKGTPTTSGVFAFDVRVTDRAKAHHRVATADLAITVGA
jgi:hypothetical protein